MEIIKTIAGCQGAFVLGVSVVILFYYLRLPHEQRSLQYHIILISASYNLITAATMISVYREVYSFGDAWFLVVGIGYLFGDISLMTMLRRVVKKHKPKK